MIRSPYKSGKLKAMMHLFYGTSILTKRLKLSMSKVIQRSFGTAREILMFLMETKS